MSVKFSDGVRLTIPSPISHNIARKNSAAAAHNRAGRVKAGLVNASAGIPVATVRKGLRNATVGGAPNAGPTTTFAKPPSAAKLKV